MIIFDSSAVSAMIDLRHLDLLGSISKMCQNLVIPHRVYGEVLRGPSGKELEKMISEKKLRVTRAIEDTDVDNFKEMYGQLHAGEIDTMLTYERISGRGESLCILDDKHARNVARLMGIKFTGMFGLLCVVRDRGIISAGAFDVAIEALKKSGFYMPKDIR